MSFGGSVQAMITSLKNNANLLRKRELFDRRKRNYSGKISQQLKFKEVSTEELDSIKNKIRENSRKQRQRNVIFFISFSLIISLFMIWFITNFNSNLEEEYRQEDEEMKMKLEELNLNYAERNERLIIYYLNSGYRNMNEGNFDQAKSYFYKAYQIDNNDFRVNYANAELYVRDCIENKENCETAEKLLNGLVERYGMNTKIKDLEGLFKSKK